jgi:hypothetical protein
MPQIPLILPSLRMMHLVGMVTREQDVLQAGPFQTGRCHILAPIVLSDALMEEILQ